MPILPLFKQAILALLALTTLLMTTQAFAMDHCAPPFDTLPFNTPIERLHSNNSEPPCQHLQNSKAVLVVNTASHCGFTKQFKGLEALYKKYQNQGLTILGFPSNSFFQEEKSEEGTANICFKNFGVTFPMFTHVKVRGKNAHPIFVHLAEKSQKPSWNFNKYLMVGDSVTHFGSRVKPLDSDLEKAIAQALETK